MWASLSAWFRARRASSSLSAVHLAAARRWVIADVESSGLDAERDRLLAIAAVAVHFDEDFRHPRIALGDTFEIFVQQTEPHTKRADKANILIHGIGVGAQRSGRPPQQAFHAWARFVADAPLVAYHSAFDQTLIDRASRSVLGHTLPHHWLDLEAVAAVVHQDPRQRHLDHWLKRRGIQCLHRHQAAADALATAELLLSLWPLVRARVDGRFPSVADWAESHRFIPGRLGSR